jgi:hypothetical protein
MKTRRLLAHKQAEGVDENTLVNYIKFPLGIHHGSDPGCGSRVGIGKTLVATGGMVAALEKTFGRDVLGTTFSDDSIVVAVQVGHGDALFRGPTLRESLERSCRELPANVSTGAPKPHGVALTDDTLVPWLKQVTKSCHTGSVPPPILVDADGEYAIPVLDPQAYDEPEPSSAKELSRTFRVTGSCLGKDGVMSAKLDHDSLWVRVEPAIESLATSWTIATFREGVWVDGKVVQLANGNWQLQDGARVVSHPALPLEDAGADEATK